MRSIFRIIHPCLAFAKRMKKNEKILKALRALKRTTPRVVRRKRSRFTGEAAKQITRIELARSVVTVNDEAGLLARRQ